MMETITRAPIIAFAAVLASGTAGAAGPVRSSGPTPVEQQAPAKIVLASADDAHSQSVSVQAETAPAKRRLARVTTCRCGDPQPVESADEE